MDPTWAQVGSKLDPSRDQVGPNLTQVGPMLDPDPDPQPPLRQTDPFPTPSLWSLGLPDPYVRSTRPNINRKKVPNLQFGSSNCSTWTTKPSLSPPKPFQLLHFQRKIFHPPHKQIWFAFQGCNTKTPGAYCPGPAEWGVASLIRNKRVL